MNSKPSSQPANAGVTAILAALWLSLLPSILSAAVPVINSAANKECEVGQFTYYEITTSGGTATSYGATGLPPGVSINMTTGIISGTPLQSALAAIQTDKEYPVILTASNGSGTGQLALSLFVRHRQQPISTPPFPTNLESRPGAPYVIYLDFDGETITTPYWNNNTTTVCQPSGLDDTQVRQIFEAVKEDFRPFNVNVTTNPQRYADNYRATPPFSRIRMIITPTDKYMAPGDFYLNADAACHGGSFSQVGWTSALDPTYPGMAWVKYFNDDGTIFQAPRDLASSISHELGHAFRLDHDGGEASYVTRPLPFGYAEYFYGTGRGDSAGPLAKIGGLTKNLSVWTPLLGSNTQGFLTQWSKGDYWGYKMKQTNGIDNQLDPDDVAVIAGSQNYVDYATDPEGNTVQGATFASFSTNVVFDGSIGRTASGGLDIDVLRFTMTGPGVMNVLASPREPLSDVFPDATPLEKQALNLGITNLYMSVELLDSAGNQLETFTKGSSVAYDPADPNGLQPTEFFRRYLSNKHLAAGTYHLRISGAGLGTPLTTQPQLQPDSTQIKNLPVGFTSYGSMGGYKLRGTIDFDPVITSTSSVSATVGVLFNHPIVATNSPTSYSASNLPPGLAIDAATGLISGAPTAAGTYMATIGAYHNQASGYQTLTIAVTDNGELADAVDALNLVWGAPVSPSDFLGWYRVNVVNHNLVTADAAQSSDIGDSQRAGLQTQVTGPGTLSFWWKVSSETRWDALRFEIDGQVYGSPISGETGWTQVTAQLGTGVHTLRWVYEKDGSVSVGLDAGWVDEVAYTQILPPVITSPSILNAEQGTLISYPIVATNSPTSYPPPVGVVPGMSLPTGSNIFSGTPTTADTFPVTLGASNAAGTGYLTLTVNVAPSIVDAVDNFSQSFSRSGAGNWMGQQTISQIGGDAAQSPAITHNQSATLQTTVNGPLNLSFWWKSDCEATNDYLICRDNGVEIIGNGQGRISGSTNWAQVNASLGSGSHTITWTYQKNASISIGVDAAWVDGILFGPAVPVITSPSSVSMAVGSTLNYTITATNSPTSYNLVGTWPPGTFYVPENHLLTGLPAQAGSWTATVSATNAAGTTTQNVTFNFASSRSGWNTANGLTGVNALPLTDTDHDGLPNLLEMALARNPNTRDDGFQPVDVDPVSGKLRARFRYNRRLADLTYYVETSTDAVNWTPIFNTLLFGSYTFTNGTTVIPTFVQDLTNDLEILDQTVAGTMGRKFMRIRVVETPPQ